MLKATKWAIFTSLLAVNSILAQVPATGTAGKAAEEAAKKSERGFLSEFFGGLEWWVWVLVVLLIALIGVFLYVRNKGEDD